ncbi:flagellar motor protein MotB [Desulfocucumis palustris]|uniref:flagellar motor protein MotB n=1 Tax=Desulfocucumis palustris TaxID=1898651 RepID=UPI000CE9E6B4|nr:flagellar motor protein MotB [Desulfocucumis palustris]
MKRSSKKQKKDNSERWLLTYSDMITLLLIFFIVLYTMSKIDVEKWRVLSNSLTQALGAGGMVLDAPGPSMVEGLSQPETIHTSAETAQLEKLKQQLQEYITKAQLDKKVSVSTEERGIVLSFQEEVLFNLGSAELTPSARGIIHKIGPILETVPNYMRIEGHTDDLPINTRQYPSNWELSAARAINVLRELEKGFDILPQRLSAAAYGEFRPRAPNISSDNRQLNRRVNIVIMRNKFIMTEPESARIVPAEEFNNSQAVR